jgi:hypothetical protein
MTKKLIDYAILVDEAMYTIVKKSMQIFAKHHQTQENHFFVSFITDFPGVSLSKKLRQRYPEEMTIVLQYQFEDLIVEKDKFSVVLSFDNVKECIVIPFKAMTAFADPSEKFGLQFKHYGNEEDFGNTDFDEEDEDFDFFIEDNLNQLSQNEKVKKLAKKDSDKVSATKSSKKNNDQVTADSSEKNNVINLDHFRKKN